MLRGSLMIQGIETMIWYFAIGMMSVVVIAMAARGLFSEFPAFGCFAVYEVIGNLVTHWTKVNYDPKVFQYFFFVYWIGWFLEAVLIIVSIQEIFRVVLRPYCGFRHFAPKFYWIGVFLFSAVSLWMHLATPRPEVAAITTSLISMQRSISFVQISLLFLLFLFCKLFGLRWRHYVFGIALGFALAASVETIASSFRVEVGWGATNLYILLAPLAFDIGALVWTIFAITSEAKEPATAPTLSPQLARWNAALEELIAK